MAFSLIAAEKLYRYLFLKSDREFPSPDLIKISLHEFIPPRTLTNYNTKIIAQTTTGITWEYAGESHKIHNNIPIKMIADDTARVVCLVTWGIVDRNPIDREVYPIDIIPLLPFQVNQGQQIEFPQFAIQIVLGDHNLTHRDFASLLLGHFYIPGIALKKPSRSLFTGQYSLYGNVVSFGLTMNWELQPAKESNSLSFLANKETEVVPVGGTLTGDLYAQHSLEWTDGSVTPITAQLQTNKNLQTGNNIIFAPGQIELFLERGNLTLLGPVNFELKVLDIPLLNKDDFDLGVYLTVIANIPWSTAKIAVSRDGGSSWTDLTTIDNSYQSRGGKAIAWSASGVPTHLTADLKTSIEVELLGSVTFTNPSNLEWYNEKLLVLWGKELISVGEVTSLSSSQFQLQKLIRGLRGTEGEINTHQPTEPLIFLDNLKRIPLRLADLDRDLLFRADFDNGEILTVPLTFDYLAYRAYAPTFRKIVRNYQTGDLTIYLAHRSLHDRWGERSEAEVKDANSNVLRILTSNSSNIIYKRSDQLTDFGILPQFLSLELYAYNDHGRSPGISVVTEINIFE